MPELKGRLSKEKEEQHYVPRKESFMERSPRSPLSTHSPPTSSASSLDLAMDGLVENNTIEDLYNNVCDMQSSDHSQSKRSYLSYGEESRLDSELNFLAGVSVSNGGGQMKKVVVKDDIFGEKFRVNPAGFSCDSPTLKSQVRRHSCVELPSEASKKATMRSKTQNGKPPSMKGVKKWGTSSSAKIERGRVQSVAEEDGGEAKFLGPYLLKQARDLIATGVNPQKALDSAVRAMKSFEASSGGEKAPDLDYVMCLHVVSHCTAGSGGTTRPSPFLRSRSRFLRWI